MAARKTKSYLKTRFETGDKPTQADFSDFIDTTLTPEIQILTISNGTVNTDASTGDIFKVLITTSVTLTNPINAVDGQVIIWWLTQGTGGNKDITLDTNFVVPPLPTLSTGGISFSSGEGALDMLIVQYSEDTGKFYVKAFIPGFGLSPSQGEMFLRQQDGDARYVPINTDQAKVRWNGTNFEYYFDDGKWREMIPVLVNGQPNIDWGSPKG
jgi:hypothetical protein